MIDPERAHQITVILAAADPVGLIAAGAPLDEYAPEADTIAELEQTGDVDLHTLKAVFDHWFGEAATVYPSVDDPGLEALHLALVATRP